MIKIAKYEFDSKEQVISKIASLGIATDENGNEYPTHKHVIVHLGNIVLGRGEFEYDEENRQITAPVLSSKWHVDVLWKDLEADENGNIDHPDGWKSYAVDVGGNGVHSFSGLDYEIYKLTAEESAPVDDLIEFFKDDLPDGRTEEEMIKLFG